MDWYILGCIVSGSFGFLLCAMFVAAKEADGRMYSMTTPLSDGWLKPLILTGNRAERRRQWRESWRCGK